MSNTAFWPVTIRREIPLAEVPGTSGARRAGRWGFAAAGSLSWIAISLIMVSIGIVLCLTIVLLPIGLFMVLAGVGAFFISGLPLLGAAAKEVEEKR